MKNLGNKFSRISWRDLAPTATPFLVALVVVALVTFHFLQPAPPNRLTIGSGPVGSSFQRSAERYRKILARNGVTLQLVPSEGSQQNLQRLLDDKAPVDVALVQGGLGADVPPDSLMSLGSLFYEPLYIFYHGSGTLKLLSELRGRRVAIGPVGSGTRVLALSLLKANGLDAPGAVQLSDLGGKEAAAALEAKQLDAAFLMSDSAASDDVRGLLHSHVVRLYDVAQVDGYLRHFRFLSRLELGPGTFDLGENIPAATTTLLAPTVELLARPGLHPALSDLLIEAAREVHGNAGLLRQAKQFPAPLEHEYPISDDADRYYKSGKTFSYRHLPFWLASLVDRVVVVVIPALLVLVPALRIVPMLYRWRISRRIHRRYADLIALERETLSVDGATDRARLATRLEHIDKAVINLKVPPSFANQVYVLREHIKFVRERLGEMVPAAAPA
jgi:hypothetical protein